MPLVMTALAEVRVFAAPVAPFTGHEAASDIRAVGDGLHVVDVHAGPIATEVVDLHPVRDGAALVLPRQAMGVLAVARPVELPVAVLQPTSPYSATRQLDGLRLIPEPRGE